MNTKAYRRAIQSFAFRLCVSVFIIGGGWLYPAWRLRYDPDIRSDPDFRAGALLPLALCIGIAYAGMACWRFYCTREDLHYDSHMGTPPHE
jgi:hypothetical protein